MPPARRTYFLFVFLKIVNSPIGALNSKDSPIFALSSVFLKPDSFLIFVVMAMCSSVGDEEIVKCLVGPLSSGYCNFGRVR